MSYRGPSYIWVYLPGVTDYTLGQTRSWCGGTFYDTGALSCGAAPQSGTFVVQTSGRMAFTPKVVNPAVSAGTPTIVGIAKVGHTLFVKPGAWGPAPVALTYQRKRNGKPVPGATKTAYPLSPSDKGAAITVTVNGSKSGYTSVSRTSTATPSVAAGTLTTAAPVVAGQAKVGSTLKMAVGAWGPKPVTLTYQWRANGRPIAGATHSSFKILAKHKTMRITVTVTGFKSGYATASRSSKATAAVK